MTCNLSKRKQESGQRQGEEGCERGFKMMCLQLPAVNKPSQHPGPHWLGWLRVAPRALHSIPPPSSISIFSPLIFHSYSFFFFPFLLLFSLFYLPSYSASFLESFPLFASQSSSHPPSAKHPLHMLFTLYLCLSHFLRAITLHANPYCPAACRTCVPVCIYLYIAQLRLSV